MTQIYLQLFWSKLPKVLTVTWGKIRVAEKLTWGFIISFIHFVLKRQCALELELSAVVCVKAFDAFQIKCIRVKKRSSGEVFLSFALFSCFFGFTAIKAFSFWLAFLFCGFGWCLSIFLSCLFYYFNSLSCFFFSFSSRLSFLSCSLVLLL